jgi:hypothetical protein
VTERTQLATTTRNLPRLALAHETFRSRPLRCRARYGAVATGRMDLELDASMESGRFLHGHLSPPDEHHTGMWFTAGAWLMSGTDDLE